VDWQAEAALENVLAVPDADRIVQGLAGVLESTAGVLARIDALAAPSRDGQGREVDPKLRELHQLLFEGKELAIAGREAAVAFAQLARDRPKLEVGATPVEAEPPFDIHAFTAAGAQSAQTLREATDLIREARSLVESEPATRRVGELVDAAALGIARQHRETIDHAAWRVAQLALLSVVLVSLYTGLLCWLRRRGWSARAEFERRGRDALPAAPSAGVGA
jgi:hypothetical protein